MPGEALKPFKIRIHLLSGEIIDADPDEVQTSPPWGAFVVDPNTKMQLPLAIVVVSVRKKDRPHVVRSFAGSFVLEVQQEESRIVIGAPPMPGLRS